MRQDLDTLKSEIQEALEAAGFIVFHGCSRLSETHPMIHWDSLRHPDFHLFLETARRADTRFVVFHHREFSADMVDEAKMRLEDAEAQMPREEQRNVDRRLRELKPYAGFTCALELSFDHHGQTYIYAISTPWYDDFLDLIDEIEDYIQEAGEAGEEGPLGGYYSQN